MELNENALLGGRYRLSKQVGKGAFGEVWLARDEQVGMEVAIKIYIALDDRGIKELKEEYSGMYRFSHPNLPHATYFDVDGDRPYLVMPFCPGSVIELIDTSDETEVWKFIRGTAAGLEYLHGEDIIHRDIKPDNILHDPKGRYMITDFGVSLKMKSTLRRSSSRSKNQCDFSGTSAYMGPEMFSDTQSAVKATDIWALGATLYEILTGELPFFGKGGVMLSEGAKVPKIPVPWSDNLRNLVRSCLAADTWDRPTATQLRKFADLVLDGQNPTWSQSAAPKPAPSSKPQPKTTKDTQSSSTKTIVLSAIAVVVLLIAGIIGVNEYIAYKYIEKHRAVLDSIYNSIKAEREAADKRRRDSIDAANSAPEVIARQQREFNVIFTVNGVSFMMVAAQGGTFDMGYNYRVTLSSYHIGETEVTQELWQAVMGSNPSSHTSNGLQCPVENVSWDDCQLFISKLNSLTGKNFRLPTEAEWEFAARGGNKSRGCKYSGSDVPDSVAWYGENSGNKTRPVKTNSPNELGLYDMTGLVS